MFVSSLLSIILKNITLFSIFVKHRYGNKELIFVCKFCSFIFCFFLSSDEDNHSLANPTNAASNSSLFSLSDNSDYNGVTMISSVLSLFYCTPLKTLWPCCITFLKYFLSYKTFPPLFSFFFVCVLICLLFEYLF